MPDWTTARVVRDRYGDLWGSDPKHPGSWVPVGCDWQNAEPERELLRDCGPLVAVLDSDGRPVARTVGDLTARHIGKRVRVETDRTLPHRVRLLREIATASNEAARLTLEVIDHPEWFLMAHFTLDTPCEVIE